MDCAIEIFPDEQDGIEGVGMILHQASIVESGEGELAAGCKLSMDGALKLAHGLMACLERLQEEN